MKIYDEINDQVKSFDDLVNDLSLGPLFRDFTITKVKGKTKTGLVYKNRKIRTYIEYYASATDKHFEPKRAAKMIRISKESMDVKNKQKQLNSKLNQALKDMDDENLSYAFNGKHLYASAEKHIRNYHFFTFDFTDFFDSLNIETFFKMYSCDDLNLANLDEAFLMIAGTTDRRKQYKSGKYSKRKPGYLSQGLVLSPVISNLILVDFDKHMNKFINKLFIKYSKYYTVNKPVYTRYADDIVISFPKQLINNGLYVNRHQQQNFLKKIMRELKKEMRAYISKNINDGKTSIYFNDNKSKIITFNKQNHVKILSWNIVKGANGKDNYITAGRKATNRGLHSYQDFGIKKSELILKNENKKNL